MVSSSLLIAAVASCLVVGSQCATARPSVVDSVGGVTYRGINRNGIEVYLGIPYGETTAGANRFKPPKAKVVAKGTTVDAGEYGDACPQAGNYDGTVVLTQLGTVSENCLNLDIARPKGTASSANLPVMVWIYGGGFFAGQTKEITTAPDGLILESVNNGSPVIHVAMNYRLNVFGFAQSNALKAAGSMNAALRDQRLALEWVQKNIKNFGGDPSKVTIFGQSSGGLSVGMQILAYGGSKSVPFKQGICESQALEQGITATYTIDAMKRVVDKVGCNSNPLHSSQTIDCLRNVSMDVLLQAAVDTQGESNGGDVWLPGVDGDFLPAAPSALLKQGKFAKVPAMIGWCEDDLSLAASTDIQTAQDTQNAIAGAYPSISSANLQKLLNLYKSADFVANEAGSAEFVRTGRILRDLLMVCPPVKFGKALAAAGNDVYLYDWNQTIMHFPGYGVFHTSEFAYVFGNLSHYEHAADMEYNPTASDKKLAVRAPRSWSNFAATGKPGVYGKDTFQGFSTAFSSSQPSLFVIGGPSEGLSAFDGSNSKPAVKKQKLNERCNFINSDEMVAQLKY